MRTSNFKVKHDMGEIDQGEFVFQHAVGCVCSILSVRGEHSGFNQ